MEIRSIVPGDRPLLEAMLAASFRPEEVIVALELIDHALEGSDDYWVRVGADVPGVPKGIAGYICFGPTPMTDATYDLYWIVTHPRARGRGVASALITSMENELRERAATGIRVETSETENHDAARRLYARLDYPVAAHLADFYRAGDGLILYYKRLL